MLSATSNVPYAEICTELLKIQGVENCFKNSILKFNSKEDEFCKYEIDDSKNTASLLDIVTGLSPCQVFRREPIPPFHVQDGRARPAGLSPYWAQEYVGADLTREALKLLNLKENASEKLVQVWDSDSDHHGTKVSNLISGPYETGVVPSEKKLGYKNLHEDSDYLRNYEKFHQDCILHKSCPAYINNSMVWENGLIGEVAKRISDSGSVIITAAGNDRAKLEPAKVDAALDLKVIVVSSLAPDGHGSKFSNFGLGVTIAAPADLTAFSYDADGKPVAFGGTSAATPIVTGSLEAFTVVTGHRLSGKEATRLLQKTALPFPFYPDPNGLGGGILNSYKIFEVASRLKKLCEFKNRDKDKCIEERLNDDSVFDFPHIAESVIHSFDRAMPICDPNKTNHGRQEISCSEKKRIISEVRKAAFLNPQSKELWGRLACIYKNEGFESNAKFYESLANRPGQVSELSKQMFLEKNDDFYRYLFPVLDLNRDKKWLEELINKGIAREEIVEKILTDPRFYNNEGKELLIKIIETSCCDQLVVKTLFTQKNWQSENEIISRIIENGRADKELALHLFSSLHWNDMDVVEKVFDRGVAASEIISSVLVRTDLDDRKLLEKLISKSEYNQDILVAKRGSTLGSELLQKIVIKGNADKQAIAFQIRHDINSQNLSLIKIIVLRNQANDEIQEHILKNPEWRKFLAKELLLDEKDLHLEKLKEVFNK